MVFLVLYFERRIKAMLFFHAFSGVLCELWGSCSTGCSGADCAAGSTGAEPGGSGWGWESIL